MGIFNKKEKGSNKVYWRDSSGTIRCPGKKCPVDCDSTCPIYMNTEAAILCQKGMDKKALQVFEKIVVMAPDFYDPWNNMGALYGDQGNYQKAHDCFEKAHEISPERPAPVYGLALTTKDLQRYAECVKWCDMYEKLTGDHQLDGIKRAALSALGR